MPIKKAINKIIRKSVTSPFTWPLFNLIYRFAYRFKFEKELVELEKKKEAIDLRAQKMRSLFPDLTVKTGPFKGMRYSGFIAHGSAMYPKLLGSYESELHDTIEKFVTGGEYREIIDIGCAEGYYAVGLAMRFPGATVYAYDINEDALRSCREMAEINKVDERVRLNGSCTSETLKKFKFTGKGLIICDCEGYELALFKADVMQNIKNCDLIIELHDVYNELITPTLTDVFKETHNIIFVKSENTFIKSSKYGELKNLDSEDIQLFMQERRGIMEWAVLTSK